MTGPVPSGSPPSRESTMPRSRLTVAALATTLLTVLALASLPSGAAEGARRPGGDGLARSPELSVASSLADRRSLVVGDRFWSMGAQDGSYPATGFHTRGEMGGFWTPPIKLLDGLWFRADGTWLKAGKYTSGWGYQRMDLGTHGGVKITRTDFAPDGVAGRPGRAAARRDRGHHAAARGRCPLRADEGLPLGRVDAQPDDVQPPGHGQRLGEEPRLPRAGHPAGRQRRGHDYAAVVGSSLTPSGSDLGPAHRGPQGDVICPASGPDARRSRTAATTPPTARAPAAS